MEYTNLEDLVDSQGYRIYPEMVSVDGNYILVYSDPTKNAWLFNYNDGKICSLANSYNLNSRFANVVKLILKYPYIYYICCANDSEYVYKRMIGTENYQNMNFGYFQSPDVLLTKSGYLVNFINNGGNQYNVKINDHEYKNIIGIPFGCYGDDIYILDRQTNNINKVNVKNLSSKLYLNLTSEQMEYKFCVDEISGKIYALDMYHNKLKVVNKSGINYLSDLPSILRNQFYQIYAYNNVIFIHNYESGENVLISSKLNQPPKISDYDSNLGNKNNAFSINYTVWDENNDTMTVEQRLNNKKLASYSNVATGSTSTVYITDEILKNLPLNQSQYIYIMATDSNGETTTRTFTFTRTNSVPIISDYDMDLGDKNRSFSINYTTWDTDGDTLNIVETLNGETLRNLSNLKGIISETISISDEQLYKLQLNKKNTLQITVSDNKGGQATRIYTFTRTNTPVAISVITKSYPTIKFRCTDADPNGSVTKVEVYINQNLMQTYTNGFDSELKYNIDFSYLNEGNNNLIIKATDNQLTTSSKTLNVHKKSLQVPYIGTDIIVKGKKYNIINRVVDKENMKLVLNKPLQDDIDIYDRIEILNDFIRAFAKTDEDDRYTEMKFVKSKDLGNGYAEDKYEVDVTGRKVSTKVDMYGNTAIKEIKEAFQYLED